MSHFRPLSRTLSLIALAALTISTPTFAQEKGSFAFTLGGGSGQGLMFGGPMNMRGPAKFGSIDPAYRNTAGLLLRNDVRSELVLSSKQREEVEALDKGEKSAAPKPLKFEFNSRDEGAGSPEEMKEKIERKMRDFFSTSMDERNKKAESALRADQNKRIGELDIQWRGPLALVDPKLAEKVDLSSEQRGKVQELYQEYRAAQSKIMSEAMKDFIHTQEDNSGDNGNVQKRVAISVRIPSEKDMTPKQRELFEKRDKDIEEARKSFGEKALALLNADQKQVWQSLQGKKFTFRMVD